MFVNEKLSAAPLEAGSEAMGYHYPVRLCRSVGFEATATTGASVMSVMSVIFHCHEFSPF
jgi:hypothetical protein